MKQPEGCPCGVIHHIYEPVPFFIMAESSVVHFSRDYCMNNPSVRCLDDTAYVFVGTWLMVMLRLLVKLPSLQTLKQLAFAERSTLVTLTSSYGHIHKYDLIRTYANIVRRRVGYGASKMIATCSSDMALRDD